MCHSTFTTFQIKVMGSNERQSSLGIQIRFADIDLAGHVHNAVYLHWFELGRMQFQERFIAKDHDWRVEGLILARTEVDYRSPVRLGDAIELRTWCSAVGNKSFVLNYFVERISNGQRTVVAEGMTVLVCFSYEQDRTIPVPGTWRNALDSLLVN